MNLLREAQKGIKLRFATALWTVALFVSGLTLLFSQNWKIALGVWLLGWAYNSHRDSKASQ